ncbi:TPA: hypothetical protein HA241_01300 [Candidatus Woesearchaeota archaeon]|nr:hypothetical protein [Candidatus Woesearchaeota archaeon]
MRISPHYFSLKEGADLKKVPSLRSSRRGSTETWWIIIGAVIALVVLIVLMVMFTGKTRPLEQGLADCESKSGLCIPNDVSCPQRTLRSTAFNCADVSYYCCIGSPVSYPQPEGCTESPIVDARGKEWCQ